MRHQKKTVKLGRTAEHRKALLANQVCSLIEHGRIKTTLAKAKAVRPFAERMVTLGKKGSLHNRRTAIAYLHQPTLVKKLFEEVAPRSANRAGGYTRIIKLGPRHSDSALMAYIEWVDFVPGTDETESITPAKSKTQSASATPELPFDKPQAKPEASKPEGSKPAKKRVTGSRAVADKAKRAVAKDKRQKSAIARSVKPKVTLRGKARKKS